MEYSSIFENIIKSFINLTKPSTTNFSMNIKPKNKLYFLFTILIIIIALLGVYSTKKNTKKTVKEKLQKELGYLLLLFIIFVSLFLYVFVLNTLKLSLSDTQYNGISIIIFFFICFTLYKKLSYFYLLKYSQYKQNKLTKLLFMPVVVTGFFLILFIINQCFDILSRIDYIGKLFQFMKINSKMKNIFDYCIYYLVIELILIFIYCSYIYINLKDTELLKFFCSNNKTSILNKKCFDVIINDISENTLFLKLFYMIVLILSVISEKS